ncbi:hypothetical protein BOX15_Mlig003351g2 [Macrostomum lignano]|uniref:C2H2-type domain-containing protein n=1 Tax=Macrostomum lignano TaxID=282301 RepID=A0A267GAZ8_9PLAT|nr:hypothetical protein BOX15_Mlig003351g2 [Macrostomum lignano]
MRLPSATFSLANTCDVLTDTATPMSEALAPAAPRTVVLDPDPMSEISRRAERLRSEAADAGAVLYPCGFCRKVFKFKYEYERHAKIHSGDRPWSCNQCYKTFSRKDNMRAHMKIHTGELVRHECGVCGKSYGRKYDLQVHERVHSGERPFQCASCGRSFISTSRLRAHQLIHCKNIYLPRHVRNKGSLHHQQQLCLLPPALPPPQTPQPSSTPSLSSLASPLPSSLPPTAGEVELDLDDTELEVEKAKPSPSVDSDSAMESPADCSGCEEPHPVCRIDVAAKMRQLESALMQRKAELASRGIKVEVDDMLDLDSRRLLDDEAQFHVVLPEPADCR